MKKVKYISLYRYDMGPEYRVRFNRGDKAAETPMYRRPTPASLKRVESLFFSLSSLQLTLMSNYVHMQAYTKETDDD